MRFECAPEIVDVVLTAMAIVGKGIERGIEIVEQRYASEIAWLLRIDAKLLRKRTDDSLSICFGYTLIEKPVDREGVDVYRSRSAIEFR